MGALGKLTLMDPVRLIEKETEAISISLNAQVNPDGSLVLSGQDLGQYVEEFWGDLDYEYFIIIPRDQKPVLLRRLLVEADRSQISIRQEPESTDDERLLLLLRAMFRLKVFANDSDFQKWLTQQNIKYEFHSYV